MSNFHDNFLIPLRYTNTPFGSCHWKWICLRLNVGRFLLYCSSIKDHQKKVIHLGFMYQEPFIFWCKTRLHLARFGFIHMIMNSMKPVIPLHFIFMIKDSKRCCDTTTPESIHTKDGKKTWFCISFHLWCELTSTTNVTGWQVSWNSGKHLIPTHRWVMEIREKSLESCE